MGVVGRAGPQRACHSLQGPPCRGDSEAESGARRLPLVSAWMRVWGHSGRCAVHIKRTSLRSRKRWQQGLAVAGGPPGPGVDAEACSAQTVAPWRWAASLARQEHCGMALRTAAPAREPASVWRFRCGQMSTF